MTEDEEREDWMNAPMGKPKEWVNVIEALDRIKKNQVVILKKRVELLEEKLDKLTEVVKAMSNNLIRWNESAKEFIKKERLNNVNQNPK